MGGQCPPSNYNNGESMSENSHSYQVSNEVPVEQVNTTDVANAIDEKMFEQQAAQHQNANDVEREQNAEVNEEPKNEEDSKWDSKFAALSRKEKEIRERERDVESKIAQFEARMAELEAKNAPVVEPEPEVAPLEYRLKKDPIKTLEEIGLPYETLTKLVLNDGQMPAEMQMKLMREELENDYKSKFDELNNKLIEKEKAEEEAKYNQVINSFKTEINDYVNESEKYELIQANSAHDLVYDVIEQYYQENGRILDTVEAADQVEQYLEEELQKVLQKTKKLGNWNPEAVKPAANTSTRQSPTLSNSLSAQGAPKTESPLTTEQSLARAASLIKWED